MEVAPWWPLEGTLGISSRRRKTPRTTTDIGSLVGVVLTNEYMSAQLKTRRLSWRWNLQCCGLGYAARSRIFAVDRPGCRTLCLTSPSWSLTATRYGIESDIKCVATRAREDMNLRLSLAVNTRKLVDGRSSRRRTQRRRRNWKLVRKPRGSLQRPPMIGEGGGRVEDSLGPESTLLRSQNGLWSTGHRITDRRSRQTITVL